MEVCSSIAKIPGSIAWGTGDHGPNRPKQTTISPGKRASRHLDGLSANRQLRADGTPCVTRKGRAFLVRVAVPMRLPDVARVPGVISYKPVSGQ